MIKTVIIVTLLALLALSITFFISELIKLEEPVYNQRPNI